MPLVPVALLLFVAASAAIVINQLRADLSESAIGLGLVLSASSTPCGVVNNQPSTREARCE
ncbi:MAG: hypothetical protein R2712_11080 [Vicinamibacterales bacterium]